MKTTRATSAPSHTPRAPDAPDNSGGSTRTRLAIVAHGALMEHRRRPRAVHVYTRQQKARCL